MTNAPDPFLRQRILDLTDTPMQRKLRKLAPMPVGAVFLPWPGMTEETCRAELRRMREHGFTCLKQTMPLLPDWPTERILNIALDEDVYPFWYAEAGWEDITPELLTRLNLDPDMDIDAAMAHPDMIAYQKEVIRKQISEFAESKKPKPQVDKSKLTREQIKALAERTPGVVGDVRGHDIHPDAVPAFVAWLKDQYGDVETLKKAWNVEHVGLDGKLLAWKTWEDVEAGVETDVHSRDYRNLRDKMRFRADTYLKEYIQGAVDRQHARNPNVPVRAGGEMGLFLPFASRGTDMEGIADVMAEGGSFYPSIHLTWHFEEVHFEVARPVYMQAALTTDWGKGIWNATWESSGGPSWFSGGKSPFVPWAADKTPGHTCHEGIQSILMLSWLAAGYRGFGLWTWNGRTAGWEAGEFMLLDRNNKITPRARLAGAIGNAARTYRRELWNADKEPLVGVLQDWENEALYAAMSVTGRDKYKSDPIRARIGASRALINGNIPWEHVTARQIGKGLAPRYACIYLPAFLCLTEDLLDNLTAYVQQGGRVVMDMPAAYIDNYGRVLSTAAGSKFETLFGVELNEYAYSRPVNTTFSIHGHDLEGFTASMTPTTARVLAGYDDRAWPAITENTLGEGTAVVLGAEASTNCCLPGNTAMEQLIRELSVVDPARIPHRCEEAIVYRLAAPGADHYVLVNEHNRPVSAALKLTEAPAGPVTDTVTGEEISLAEVQLAPESARWLRVPRD